MTKPARTRRLGLAPPVPVKVDPRSGRDRPAQPPRIQGASIYMVGIGGCGMSGLARVLARMGGLVQGSDSSPSSITEALIADGISVREEAGSALPDETDLLIASAAINHDHPLMLAAMRRGVPTLTYAEALGSLMRACTGVAIAGTHGKSTTTAMLGALLADVGLDPSVIVGATCTQLGGGSIGSPVFASPVGYRVGAPAIPRGTFEGAPGLLIAEACEFNRSFHNFRPTIASISSVEADHLDIYGSLDAIVEAFHDFARLIPPASEGGYLLIAHDGAHRREVTAGLSCAVETIGFSPEADWVVGYDPAERLVSLARHGKAVARWAIRMPGQHNAINAAIAFVLADHLGADPELSAGSLAAFRGVDRRSQYLGERALPAGGSVRVFDDYGHHPTAVDSTLRALRESERPQDRDGRLICVFQPHQHSRTRFLLEEFAAAFSQADIVIVPHIYFVRDSEIEKTRVTAADLVDRLRRRSIRAMHLYPFEAIVEQLENVCRPGDLLVVMGAGPVWQVAHQFLDLPRPA
ncbi:MAG: UDP-N-acetylmuramate--L-alanine ligase [Phycisphaeraceae bacterium]|nr:UDP-N-acetylmuramate--L-alanine ligase [Phycisphaeraceae bacterium]